MILTTPDSADSLADGHPWEGIPNVMLSNYYDGRMKK